MIVNNPTNQDITVILGGDTYTVEANSSLSGVPRDLAIHWQTRLHTFLTLSEEGTPAKKSVSKEEVAEIVEAKADEEAETEEVKEVESAPEKKKGKK